MLDAFRKLTKKPNAQNGISTVTVKEDASTECVAKAPIAKSSASDLSKPTVVPMNQTLQTKFSRGVTYNLKIVVRGERRSGKSALVQRLKGGPFLENYVPTEEIQAACINWNSSGSSDCVKVDVWDVVDQGVPKARPTPGGLKISYTQGQMCLDAGFVDVYKGCHCAVLIFDITSRKTWEYICRELPKVPAYICVLVLGSFKDDESQRTVSIEEVETFLSQQDRPLGGRHMITYGETSMKDMFGLKFIHNYLNIPFLLLQRETLLGQLEVNALRLEDTMDALQASKDSPDQNYSEYQRMVEKRASRGAPPGPADHSVCDELDPEFLKLTPKVAAQPVPKTESDGEEELVNPLVADFEDYGSNNTNITVDLPILELAPSPKASSLAKAVGIFEKKLSEPLLSVHRSTTNDHPLGKADSSIAVANGSVLDTHLDDEDLFYGSAPREDRPDDGRTLKQGPQFSRFDLHGTSGDDRLDTSQFISPSSSLSNKSVPKTTTFHSTITTDPLDSWLDDDSPVLVAALSVPKSLQVPHAAPPTITGELEGIPSQETGNQIPLDKTMTGETLKGKSKVKSTKKKSKTAVVNEAGTRLKRKTKSDQSKSAAEITQRAGQLADCYETL